MKWMNENHKDWTLEKKVFQFSSILRFNDDDYYYYFVYTILGQNKTKKLTETEWWWWWWNWRNCLKDDEKNEMKMKT